MSGLLSTVRTDQFVKAPRRANFVIVVLSVCVWGMLLCGCRTPKNASSTHDDVFFKLHDEIKILLPLAKDSLAKGEDFKVMVNGFEVNGGKWWGPEKAPLNQRSYWLNCNSRHAFEGLNGLLTLHRVDMTHVDVVFRWCALQLEPSPIAICIDDYDLGDIQWGNKEGNDKQSPQ